MISGMSASDVPPVVRLDVVSESFTDGEKLFTTPGAVARAAGKGVGERTITVSAARSADLTGASGLEYRFVVLDGDDAHAKISQDGAKATITFDPGDAAGRIDVAVFARRAGGRYYSAPGIVSLYVRP
jgi:hypothetical protein